MPYYLKVFTLTKGYFKTPPGFCLVKHAYAKLPPSHPVLLIGNHHVYYPFLYSASDVIQRFACYIICVCYYYFIIIIYFITQLYIIYSAIICV